ncbi:MAG: FAD-dependent oxidoreductase [Gemmatimonadetes bacterium]|nr:FAD-dependent oxidoreductase [Gemmatimonadota bacterium]
MIISSPLPSSTDAIVIGAGLSGLAAARQLVEQGIDAHVVDASDAVGGRVRTDEVDGFRLDRGFQVLLTAYEELQAQVDLARLDLATFKAGSMIWTGKRLETLGDPYRNPSSVISTLGAQVGTMTDKMKVASLRRRLLGRSPSECFDGPDRSTLEELESLGFSRGFIDSFFRPFLGGVFLERELATSARLFNYYFRCFAAGDAAVPSAGMQRLPELLAEPLRGRVTLNAPVRAISTSGVTMDDGTHISADQVIVAADGHGASMLLDEPSPDFKATVTSYFACGQPPTSAGMLILDGEGVGPVNHVAVMSSISPGYAPEGMHLVSVSGVDDAADDPVAFEVEAPRQLRRWFGESVDLWSHLRTYTIPHALPRHPAGAIPGRGTRRRPDGVVVAGDHTEFGSIQGALLSGRRAAQMVLDAIRPTSTPAMHMP